MTLFTNPNFIDHIVRSQGVDSIIDQEHYPSIQTLIEIQTRLILETASKFMRRDRRDVLSLQDIELAAKQHNHSDMVVAPYGTYQNKQELIIKEDKIYESPSALMDQQLKALGVRQLQGPQLTGRWIFLKGKVPSIGQNINIKRMQQLAETQKHERQQKRKLWNIIRDEPFSFLNAEQSQYFLHISKIISTDSAPTGNINIHGNLNSLMPFILKFLGSSPLNETGISFLLKLLQNKYIWQAVEFGSVKCLNLLLAYKGPQSFQVGIKIAQIVESLCSKYPILFDIYEGYQDQSYSTILKKIPFELYLGVPFNLSEELLAKCKEDAENNDPLAVLCLKALLEHSSQLKIFKQLLERKMNTFVFWHPCPELRDDPYLKMY